MVDYINAIKCIEESLKSKYGQPCEALVSIIAIKDNKQWYKYSIINNREGVSLQGLIDDDNNIIELQKDEELKYNISTYSKYYDIRNYHVEHNVIYLIKEGNWDYINDIKKIILEKRSLIDGKLINEYNFEVIKDGNSFNLEYFLKSDKLIIEFDNKIEIYKVISAAIKKEVCIYKNPEDIVSIDNYGQVWIARKNKIFQIINKQLKEYCTTDFEFKNLIINDNNVFVFKDKKYINLKEYTKSITKDKADIDGENKMEKRKLKKTLIEKFTLSKNKIAKIEDKLELIAKGTVENLLFDFFIKNLKDGKWIRLTKMSITSSTTWSPEDTGLYIVRCRAKTKESSNKFDYYKDIKIEIV